VTTRPLSNLPRVKNENDPDKVMGDWELKMLKDCMYLQSGFYTQFNTEKEASETKLRGTRKAFIVGAAEPHQMHDMLVNKVMPEWLKPRDPAHFLNKDDDWPEIEIEQDTYITPGNAIASRERWKIGGRLEEDWRKIWRKIGGRLEEDGRKSAARATSIR
jgi:hypothetical protein